MSQSVSPFGDAILCYITTIPANYNSFPAADGVIIGRVNFKLKTASCQKVRMRRGVNFQAILECLDILKRLCNNVQTIFEYDPEEGLLYKLQINLVTVLRVSVQPAKGETKKIIFYPWLNLLIFNHICKRSRLLNNSECFLSL